LIDKAEFEHALKFIAQLKKNADCERFKIDSIVGEIQNLEKELIRRRDMLAKITKMMFEKNDEVFNLIHNQLPDGQKTT